MLETRYKVISEKKRAHRNSNLRPEWMVPDSNLPSVQERDVIDWIRENQVLSKKELEITETDAWEIARKIKEKHWSSLEVTEAFCHRATIAHQLTNCFSEVFFNEALETAKKLDEYQRETGKVKGKMHGVPISLKDNLNVKGQSTTLGIVNFCFNPEQMEEDAALVAMLRDLGAVLYVKTNVPVAMMMPETNNHVYGNTTNPMNRLLSAGGSSGGEAALIALKGSPLGIGSDIGGSIRIPASFQNLYALKPSFGRFPTYGSRSGLPGLESVNSVNGPISWNLQALEFYCKSIIDQKPWNYDARSIEIPWRVITLPKHLNIAVLYDDKVVRPTPPILRGVQIVVDALKSEGHEVIEWEPTDHLELSQIILKFFLSDGGHHVTKETNATGESLFPYMEGYGSTDEMRISELWNLHTKRNKIIQNYLLRWNESSKRTKNGLPIDAIIMPASPFAGNPHGKFHDYVGYTSPFNLLEYSVGIFPVTRVDEELDVSEDRSNFYGETDQKVYNDYDPHESHGGAVALQIVGRKFQEEKVIAMMKAITKLLNYKGQDVSR